jgi:hypothetical protein
MEIKVKIKGITPLLMHKFNEEDLESKTKRDKNMLPRECAEHSAYRTKNNELFIPAHCIFCSIMEAGKYHKIGKNKITTQKSSLIPAGLSIEEKECSLGTKDFEVDSQSVVVPATGGRIMAHRPRLDEWETSFIIHIDTTLFNERLIREIIDDAGTKCGVLAYTPRHKGWFGKFKVTEWKVLK